MKYLITGANGFIGKAVTKKLLEDENNIVYAIVTSLEEMKDIESNNLKCFCLFFESYNIIADLIKDNVDVVFHFAWSGLSGPLAKDVDVQVSNIIATSNLLNEIKKMNAKRFVFASSMNTLEVRSFLANPASIKPRGVYNHVATKMAVEIISRVFCSENGIIYNEGLIAMAYGENNKSRMIPNVFLYSLINNIEPRLVKGENEYDIIYVDDIANGMIAISKNGVAGKSYYIGHSWKKTFRQIFTEIKDILNPNLTIHFGAYPEDNAIDFSLVNKTELTTDTGWMPKYDFKQSILNTAKWIIDSKSKF